MDDLESYTALGFCVLFAVTAVLFCRPLLLGVLTGIRSKPVGSGTSEESRLPSSQHFGSLRQLLYHPIFRVAILCGIVFGVWLIFCSNIARSDENLISIVFIACKGIERCAVDASPDFTHALMFDFQASVAFAVFYCLIALRALIQLIIRRGKTHTDESSSTSVGSRWTSLVSNRYLPLFVSFLLIVIPICQLLWAAHSNAPEPGTMAAMQDTLPVIRSYASAPQPVPNNPAPSLPAPSEEASATSPSETAPVGTDDAHQATWTDPATGLVWTKQDNGSDVTWQDASNYCHALQQGASSSWRLPTMQELTGIYDDQSSGNRYPVKGNLQLSGWIWSSTQGGASGSAYSFDFKTYGTFTVPRGNFSHGRALCVVGK